MPFVLKVTVWVPGSGGGGLDGCRWPEGPVLPGSGIVVDRLRLCWVLWLCIAAWAAICEALRWVVWLDMLLWVEGSRGSK
jgi:hypothetical protein